MMNLDRNDSLETEMVNPAAKVSHGTQPTENDELEVSWMVSTEVVSRKNVDGTYVLMKMDDSNLFYKIDGIAASVWHLLQQKMSLNSVVQCLSEQQPKFKDQLKLDIPNFFNELIKNNLIIKA